MGIKEPSRYTKHGIKKMTLLDSALEKMVSKSAKNKDQVISSQIEQFWIFLILFVTKLMQIRDSLWIASCHVFCFVFFWGLLIFRAPHHFIGSRLLANYIPVNAMQYITNTSVNVLANSVRLSPMLPIALKFHWQCPLRDLC